MGGARDKDDKPRCINWQKVVVSLVSFDLFLS